MGTKDNPDYDHNSVTDLAPAIKAKITAYRKASEAYAFIGSQDPEDHESIIQTLQEARYDLQRTILTHLKKGTKALLDRCRSPRTSFTCPQRVPLTDSPVTVGRGSDLDFADSSSSGAGWGSAWARARRSPHIRGRSGPERLLRNAHGAAE